LSKTSESFKLSGKLNTNTLISAINQQIALKTVHKLGFKVNAVWNGKEALEYLLACQSPLSLHKLPDIILMDVQMPVIDGYRATHYLRHHAPYSAFLRDIPIIAMTASAIQGDREKCQKAGMDDYLAKPVRRKNLEKMLVRWANKKRNSSRGHRSGADSPDYCNDCGEYEISERISSTLGGKANYEEENKKRVTAPKRPPMVDEIKSSNSSHGYPAQNRKATGLLRDRKPRKRP